MFGNWAPWMDVLIVVVMGLILWAVFAYMINNGKKKEMMLLYCDDCGVYGHQAGTPDCPQEMQ